MLRHVAAAIARQRATALFWLADRRARREAIQAAERAHPIDDIDVALHKARASLASESDRRFGQPIARAQRDLRQALSRRDALLEQRRVLGTDYAVLLACAYRAKGDAFAALATPQAALDEAFEEFANADAKVAGWHNRAKSPLPFWGKHGEAIPDHSFFFFSKSDLDRAKDGREEAAEEIGDRRAERDAAGVRIGHAKAEILVFKAEQSEQRRLRRDGRTDGVISKEILAMQFDIERLTGAPGRLRQAQERFLTDGSEARRVAQLEHDRVVTMACRADALDAFDSPEAREKRREAFTAK